MAKFGRTQYVTLTEALGDALVDVRKTESPLLINNTMRTAHKVAKVLKRDNDGFREREFIDGIENYADLVELSQKGIH